MPNETINRMLSQGFLVQSVLFDKNIYTPRQSRLILKQRGYTIPPKVDVTDRFIRYRMHDPQALNTYKTVHVANGIKVIMAKKAHMPQLIGKHPPEQMRLQGRLNRNNMKNLLVQRSGKAYR